MKTIDNWILAIFVLLAAVSMSATSCSAYAQARLGPQGERLTPHLVLARLCAHESSLPWGLDADGDGEFEWVSVRDHLTPWGDDCFLIHEVLLRGAQRMQRDSSTLSPDQAYVAYAIAYSAGRLIEPIAHDANRWAVYLMPGPARPREWPRARWFAAGWHFAWDHTGRIVAMDLDELRAARPFTCDGPVHDWASEADGTWARAHGRERVQCDGHLVNHAYRRPHLASQSAEAGP